MRAPVPIVLCLAAVFATAAQIPTGAEIWIRLETPIAASTAKPNQPVRAIVIVPLLDQSGTTALPSGSIIEGKVKDRKAAEGPKDRARLRFEFDRLTSPSGAKANISARVIDVDNAREAVDEKGNITGILAAETLGARMDTGIGKLAERYPALGGILAGVKAGVISDTDPDIAYEAGVELRLVLEKPVQWNPGPEPRPAPQPIAPAAELIALVNRQPFRTMSEKPPRPSDITNLMFIGTQAEIEAAFEAAGWSVAHALSGESVMETLRAIIEVRGYKEAPMSVLTLDGKRSELEFQKSVNTFAMRHHLRIWKRPETFRGRPVWVSAATHDIAIDFSEEDRTFIHRIDPQIDKERAKVVSDLLFTGKVTGIALVDRDAVPTHSMNATGDALVTDGRMAVLQFGSSPL